jgi:hypothetical protein
LRYSPSGDLRTASCCWVYAEPDWFPLLIGSPSRPPVWRELCIGCRASAELSLGGERRRLCRDLVRVDRYLVGGPHAPCPPRSACGTPPILEGRVVPH